MSLHIAAKLWEFPIYSEQNPKGKVIAARRIAKNKGVPLVHKPHLKRKNAKLIENNDFIFEDENNSNINSNLAETALFKIKQLLENGNDHRKQSYTLPRLECSICRMVMENLKSHHLNRSH